MHRIRAFSRISEVRSTGRNMPCLYEYIRVWAFDEQRDEKCGAF